MATPRNILRKQLGMREKITDLFVAEIARFHANVARSYAMHNLHHAHTRMQTHTRVHETNCRQVTDREKNATKYSCRSYRVWAKCSNRCPNPTPTSPSTSPSTPHLQIPYWCSRFSVTWLLQVWDIPHIPVFSTTIGFVAASFTLKPFLALHDTNYTSMTMCSQYPSSCLDCSTLYALCVCSMRCIFLRLSCRLPRKACRQLRCKTANCSEKAVALFLPEAL